MAQDAYTIKAAGSSPAAATILIDMKASETQQGGDHYKRYAIQPTEFIFKNGLDFIQGNVIKYVMRYKEKNGKQDLLKAKHYIELLLEYEYGTDYERT